MFMKCFCFAVVALIGLVAAPAKGDIITSLVGQLSMQPVSVSLDSPQAVTNSGGMLHVVGSHNGRAAREVINLSSRTSMGIEYFDSLASAGGGSGSNIGRIFEVRRLDNGSMIYVGDSAGSFSVRQPTSWLAPNNPQGGVGPVGTQVSGGFTGSSSTGIIVGTTNNAVFGTHGNLPTLLPGGQVIALDISSDGNFIVGGLLWEASPFGGFDILSTSGFDFSVSGGLPSWQGVAIDPVLGKAVFAGEYFNQSTFENEVGFWDQDGLFRFSTGSGTQFTDFEIFNGQLVAAVNGFDDSALWALTDGSTLSLESILGEKSLLYDNGLYVGSVGFLGRSSSGQSYVAAATSVPELSSFKAVAGAMLFALLFLRRKIAA